MGAHLLEEDVQVGRYRLDVIAVDAEDAVRFAGGLICDRSLAGWDVSVLTGTDGGEHALCVLGATLVRELPPPAAAPHQTLAVSAAAITADDAVRDRVLEGLAGQATDVLVWDAQRTETVPAVFATVQHDVSAAAQAYRRQALRALGADHDCGATEVFSRTSGKPVATPTAVSQGAHDAHRLGHGG
ncbi:hypothetical protein JRC04_25515 [Mycolicibacterium sp. S2-37]|uniref:hypothetical protein n=1 Tax=Mycolicibacterium sp. S2-37 TaxID=2810297 RepID=UPI001A94349E|nr:hypothetical protein [Mycolicibacterium sp. S2-37]MBO0680839.1 hypothetical protein [Mycolicibacterium sp. S2-37]